MVSQWRVASPVKARLASITLPQLSDDDIAEQGQIYPACPQCNIPASAPFVYACCIRVRLIVFLPL
jgi:hypothetical protein